MKAEGLGKQGHSRSPEENARALLHVHNYQQHGLSCDAAIKATAAAELTSPSTLRAAASQFSFSGSLLAEDHRSNPKHPFHRDTGPSLAAQIVIHRLLHQVQLENTFESCNTLRTALAAEANTVVSKSTIHRWLHALGYIHGKKHFTNQPEGYRNALIRGFIYKYAKALKEQDDGSAILVFMDESYIYAHHCSAKLWYSLSSSGKNNVRGDNRGKRIIIMHAMTKDGLLEIEGVEPSNILTELYHSCALIFNEVCVDDITPADYHDTINGEKFIGWIQMRLLPTFQKLYPGKKMVLVLDNAKYHHHRGPDWFSPSNKKKGQLADFLRQRSVPSLTTENGRVIPAGKFSADARGKAGGPTLKELQAAVKQHLKEHPDINTTVPQQLMDDAGYELIYTPPYVSELQPIELIWAFTKALVAKQSTRTRSIDEAAVQTRVAMDQVTAELCQKEIAHCHKWINQFMRSDSSGSLKQFTDLATLKSWPPAAHKAAANDVAYTTPSTEEDEGTQSVAQWTQ